MTRAGQIALIPDGQNFVQKLIQFITRSPVHHVVVAVSDKFCVSAEMEGVRLRPISHFPNAIWSDFALTARQRRNIIGFALEQLGKPYAILDDIFIGISIITKSRTPQWIVQTVLNSDRWQCAELADASLLAGGIRLFRDGRPPRAVYPGSFIPTFKRRGWWTR